MNKEESDFNKGLKLLAKSSVIVFICLMFSKIITYIYRIIIARYFGAEVYGLFLLAMMILGWFIVFASLGLSEGLLRYISLYRGKKQENKIKYIFKTTLFVAFFWSIFLGIILFLFSDFISVTFFHNSELGSYLKLFSILIPISVLMDIFVSTIRTFEKIAWYSFITNILSNASKLILLLIFISLGFKINAVKFSYFFGVILVMIFSYFICRYLVPDVFNRYLLAKKDRVKIRKDLFSYSWPIMFAGVITTLFYWIDSFSIGYFFNPSYVGYYNAAVPLVSLLGLVPELFMQLFLPMITKEFSKKNFDVIKQLSQQVGKWIIILNLPLFLLMLIFPEAIISILFGKEYLPAVSSLQILSFGGIFMGLVIVSQNLLAMLGKSRIILTNLAVVSVINLGLNFFLVPRYGIAGAAIATSFVWFILTIILFVQVRRYLGIIPLRRKILNVIMVSLIPVLLVLFLKNFIFLNLTGLAILAIFFFLIYIILIFMTKCLDKNDLMILKSFSSKMRSVIKDKKLY